MKKFEFPIGSYYVTTAPEKTNPILYANIQRAIFARGGNWVSGHKEVLYTQENDVAIQISNKDTADFGRGSRGREGKNCKPAIDLIEILFQVGDKLKWGNEEFTITKTPEYSTTGIFIHHSKGLICLTTAVNVDLIPLDTKPKEKTYLEIHKESGLKVGDKVRVVRKVPSNDRGWEDSWNDGLTNYIGSIHIIEEDYQSRGFTLKNTPYRWPAHALEKVEDKKHLGLSSTIDTRYFGLPISVQYIGNTEDGYFKIPTTHSGDIAPKHLKLKKVKIKQVPFKGLDEAKKKSNLLQDKLSKKLKQKEKENEKNRTARVW